MKFISPFTTLAMLNNSDISFLRLVNQLETVEGADSPVGQSFVSCSVAMQVFDGSSFPPQACKVFISRPDFPFQLIPLAPDPLTCFLVHYRDLIEETGAGRARCVCSGLDIVILSSWMGLHIIISEISPISF